jgi:hypothetical protein
MNETPMFIEGQSGYFVTVELTIKLEHRAHERLLDYLSCDLFDRAEDFLADVKRVPLITLYPKRSENPFSIADPWLERRKERKQQWLERPRWAPHTDPKPILTLTYPYITTDKLLLEMGKAFEEKNIRDYWGCGLVLADADGVTPLDIVEEFAVEPGLSKLQRALWSIGNPIYTIVQSDLPSPLLLFYTPPKRELLV